MVYGTNTFDLARVLIVGVQIRSLGSIIEGFILVFYNVGTLLNGRVVKNALEKYLVFIIISLVPAIDFQDIVQI